MPYAVSVILNILTSGLPCCMLAIGILLTYRLLDFADLTAEGSFLMGGAICIALIRTGCNAWLATLLSLVFGAGCGLITGLLHTKLKIPKLLSGIITLTMTASLGLLVLGIAKNGDIFSNNVTLATSDQTIYSMFYAGKAMYRPIIKAAIMLGIVIIMAVVVYFFFGTEYGMAIRATGMNEKMARSHGINTNKAIITCVTISNAIIGLAGAMFAQDTRSCDIKTASGFLVIGLASILIGEAIFGKRSFKNWLISVCLGAIVYFTIVTLAIELGLPTQLKNLLYAILITIALCIPFIKKGFKSLFKLKKKEEKPA